MLKASGGETRTAALRAVADLFAERGFESPSSDARMLVCDAAQCDRLAVLSEPATPLGAEAAARLNSFVDRRLAGEPVTRILGTRAFWTLSLKVTPDVLDPRPDSECLIEAALDRLGDRRNTEIEILDLGTGTGALLLSLLAECPKANGLGLDISPAACKVATDNAVGNALADRARFEVGDWTRGLGQRFGLVISNPPYIETSSIAELDHSVRDFDPHLALDGGADGLLAYRQIMSGLSDVLAPNGFAVFELGIGQEEDVADIAARHGFKDCGRRRDLGGVVRAMIVSR